MTAASRYEATYTRMHVAHASVAPSCAIALFRDGRLEVWTHSQGVYPLRDALARMLKLDQAMIRVIHVQGPGCYGHNGADDAAADAAVIALERPGQPIRVQWRRDEEFGFEPVSPAMVVTARAVLDEAGRPADWTTEIWSGRHVSRPGSGGNLLAAEALPDPPPAPPATESSESARSRHPQWRAALRFSGETDRPSPDPRNPGAHVLVARTWRQRQCLCDRIVDRRIGGARRRRPREISAVAVDRRPRARRRRARGADQRLARGVAVGHRHTAAASALPATRIWPPTRRSSPRSRSRKRSG